MVKEVTYGMVGGDLKALIGECHRKALGLDPQGEAGLRLLFRDRRAE